MFSFRVFFFWLVQRLTLNGHRFCPFFLVLRVLVFRKCFEGCLKLDDILVENWKFRHPNWYFVIIISVEKFTEKLSLKRNQIVLVLVNFYADLFSIFFFDAHKNSTLIWWRPALWCKRNQPEPCGKLQPEGREWTDHPWSQPRKHRPLWTLAHIFVKGHLLLSTCARFAFLRVLITWVAWSSVHSRQALFRP